MVVTNVTSKTHFHSLVDGASSATVHFWAPWCEPCTHMDAVLSQLATEHPEGKFLRVEAEEVPDISEEYSVSAVPFFLFFRNGKVIDQLEGANAPELASRVAKQMSSSSANGALPGGTSSTQAQHLSEPAQLGSSTPAILEQVLASARASGQSDGSSHPFSSSIPLQPLPLQYPPVPPTPLRARLDRLVRSAPVMLFMKGNPDEPRCGFSSKVVAALRSCGTKFDTFDILQDNEVRQGLKEYSEWPTFPQLYVRGEFLGGCDIVLEMHQNGELKESLQAAKEEEEKLEKGSTVEDRIRGLLKASNTMLFMKGTPDAPRCGFSKKVVAALQKEDVPFGTFDILEDEEIRQGLKTFSQWPTFPQLYHAGELIGGCDIVLEMHQNGELKEALLA
eukprot:TRINITY_DN20928_c0_g1_i1.p1 TRINITY_DN20928_c0_g1~~TRINITY_DN20928_c0_g1_i1.p1  ORF type:complete len:431 (+),score=76.98 TRINITY_DN20928_c0_g1_i1:123-1295(+)